MFSALTKLPRTVWFLGAISFLNDAASDAVYPLLPLFFAATFAVGETTIDLIILDIMMPIFESDMVLFDSNYNIIESYSTGISLYDKLTSEMPTTKNIPIVILSARTDILKVRPDFEALRTENKIAILEKPISMKELLVALNSIHHKSKNGIR